MPNSLWRKSGFGSEACLVPADDDAVAFLGKVKPEQEVMIEPKRPRNTQQHRKLFALAELAAENWPLDITKEQIVELCKLHAGWADPVRSFDGSIHWVTKSIAFASMGQDDFERFYEQSINVLSKALGVDIETMSREVNARIAPNG